VAVSLTNVWLQTSGDGLLLDIVLPASTGNGSSGDWSVTVLHRTLAQTSEPPGDAATVLARLLAQLDAISAAGVVITSHRGGAGAPTADSGTRGAEVDQVAADAASVRFRFLPFPSPPPGHHTGAEYL
jgi:hypothetical protein